MRPKEVRTEPSAVAQLAAGSAALQQLSVHPALPLTRALWLLQDHVLRAGMLMQPADDIEELPDMPLNAHSEGWGSDVVGWAHEDSQEPTANGGPHQHAAEAPEVAQLRSRLAEVEAVRPWPCPAQPWLPGCHKQPGMGLAAQGPGAACCWAAVQQGGSVTVHSDTELGQSGRLAPCCKARPRLGRWWAVSQRSRPQVASDSLGEVEELQERVRAAVAGQGHAEAEAAELRRALVTARAQVRGLPTACTACSCLGGLQSGVGLLHAGLCHCWLQAVQLIAQVSAGGCCADCLHRLQAQDNGDSANDALAQLRQARQELAQLHEASQSDAEALQSTQSQLQVLLF